MSLLPQHERLIRIVSAIAPEVAAARGYRSIEVQAELKRVGFGAAQASLVPALLIPLWGVHGDVASYQLRPDAPRVKKGKPIKYETPSGSTMLIDVPPASRDALGDPAVPLLITEGPRKADSAVSVGFCAIDLIGVWNWRGTNGRGGTTALADWELIALNGRTVLLGFDSDVLTKPEVHASAVRLTAFLESRKAYVRFLHLPHGPGGRKMGLDDFLAAGHDQQDVLALASPHLPPMPGAGNQDEDAAPYRILDGQLCRRVKTPDGPVYAPLANYAARIDEEITLDDGAETTRQFVITAAREGVPSKIVRVSAEAFGAMGWVSTQLGARYVVTAGLGVRDHLRTAIQTLSPEARERRVFAHTGWRQLDGVWSYLTSSGAIGREGIEVDLGPNLTAYALPRVAQDPADAMRESLRFLALGPLRVTLPLWGFVWRAPTASALPIDVTLWLHGLTGAMKSTLAALALNHYGPAFDRLTLPGWSSTANQIERMLFVLKDALAVVDDYAPSATDARDLEAKSQRVLRSQGNLAARHRLRHDLTERPGFPPRGAALVTGEGHPPGASVLARTLLVDIERKAIALPKLSALQQRRDRLCHAMSGFLTWLAPQLPTLGPRLRRLFSTHRARACEGETHLRIPEALAHVWIGVTLALDYASTLGVVTSTARAQIETEGWAALLSLGQAQGQAVREEDPVLRFLRTLDSLLVQRKAQLLASTVSEPTDPGKGERFIETLGWEDPEFFYLLPEATYTAVARACRESGAYLPPDARLRSALVKAGIAQASAGHTTIAARVGNTIRRVLKLSKDAVRQTCGEDAVTTVTVVTGNDAEGGERAQEESDTHGAHALSPSRGLCGDGLTGYKRLRGYAEREDAAPDWVTEAEAPSAPSPADSGSPPQCDADASDVDY